MKLHFPHPHPTFGTKKNPKSQSAWQRSVYYWWWEYLRRNEDYKRTCQKGGKGKCATLYKDFGDVFATDFKTWWSENDRGARLFAEPPTPSIRVIEEGIVLKSPKDKTLVLEVPLNLPKNYLVKRFREILSKRHSGKKGVKVSVKTQAMYPIASGRIDVESLKKALRVWDARQEDPSRPLWMLATDLNLALFHKILPSDSPKAAFDKRNNLNATTSRYLRKARLAIAGTGKGKFPITAVK